MYDDLGFKTMGLGNFNNLPFQVTRFFFYDFPKRSRGFPLSTPGGVGGGSASDTNLGSAERPGRVEIYDIGTEIL